MKILSKYELIANGKNPINIGIGLGDKESHNKKIINASLDFIERYKSTIYFFGTEKILNKELLETFSLNKQLEFVKCQKPEESIIKFLLNDTIQAIIRGSFGSSEFLRYLKKYLNVDQINRLALLETYRGEQFFFGPVGIDECNTLNKKIIFLELAIRELQKLNITPRISVLSGGRISDIGRDEIVDQTIRIAEELISLFKEKYTNIHISHNEILIEQALKNNSNLIIAPDGISGNLIYRTLVHLGGGKAFGAIYMGLNKTIIDTSRVGTISEIEGALKIAFSLSNTK
ncbi:MAG: methanogenesis marker protein Mmp4/MtxX [Promethearchaeota archaeon]